MCPDNLTHCLRASPCISTPAPHCPYPPPPLPPSPQSLIHEGCLVPKSLYMSTIDEHTVRPNAAPSGGLGPPAPLHPPTTAATTTTAPASNSSLYKSVDLKPGQLYELVLRNDDPKSVLTWDFDVVSGCMQFTVFRMSGLHALLAVPPDGK